MAGPNRHFSRWGLMDMHGNVREWTQTVWPPGLDSKGADRPAGNVVRGGSWYDRPKRAGSSFRLAYPSWQRVFNVGFRVVCSEKTVRVAVKPNR